MPELPEVETIRRTLQRHVQGLRINHVQVYSESVVRGWQGREFAELVQGRTITGIERRGKYLLINLDQGWTMLAHMRMTGRLLYYPCQTQTQAQGQGQGRGQAQAQGQVLKHTHVIFNLEQGELHFADTRKFGRILMVPTEEGLEHPSLLKLGPEPLAEEFTPAILGQRLIRKKGNIKAVLLDQTVLAGLGNIYADEALFKAGISPERGTPTLTGQEIARLHQAIQEVLWAGIEAQGTSFRDYRDANGEKGSFQEALQVYGRGNEQCLLCGTVLERKKLAGRTTVFCTNCQK